MTTLLAPDPLDAATLPRCGHCAAYVAIGQTWCRTCGANPLTPMTPDDAYHADMRDAHTIYERRGSAAYRVASAAARDRYRAALAAERTPPPCPVCGAGGPTTGSDLPCDCAEPEDDPVPLPDEDTARLIEARFALERAIACLMDDQPLGAQAHITLALEALP